MRIAKARVAAVADGILDRVVHNAHRIEMKGDSMRKKRGGGA
jgi:DNA replication protein DnaC